MKGTIYVITNKINSKQYIGKTIQEPQRYWESHKARCNSGVKKYLYDSMRKYGIENFSFNIIEEIEAETYKELNNKLNSLEILYIKTYKSKTPHGYNLTDGGEGTVGYVFTEEHRKNLSEAMKGKPSPRKGVKLSKETRKKLSEARIGRFKGEENYFYGKKHTEETKELIKKKNTEYQNRPEIKKINQLKQESRIPVIMCDSKTLEVLETFGSLKEATRWVANNTKYKGDTGTISKAVNNGNISYGYRWFKIEKEDVETIESLEEKASRVGWR